MHKPLRSLPVLIAIAAIMPHAAAQTDATLMLSPWRSDAPYELRASVMVYDEGEADRSSNPDLDMTIFEGRFRAALTEDRDILRIGADVLHIQLEDSDPVLPPRLVDHSVAVGLGLGRTDDGWEFAATAGAGFAGDLPFSDGDAVYGKGSFIAVYRPDDKTAWQLGLDYDGNRPIFPDVPLPFLAWSYTQSDTLSYTLGFPYSAMRWVPAERLTLTASASPASVLNGGFYANIDYEFTDGLHVFATYDSRYEAFHIEGDSDNRRVFYRDRTFEGGVRWDIADEPNLTARLIAAVGIGFDRHFDRGFDARDTDTIRDLSDEPYIRLGLDFSF